MRRLLLPCAILCASLFPVAAVAQFQESIDVVRILLDVRVTDRGGEPITGLTPEDFTITVGGKKAEVASVTWVDESFDARIFETLDAEPEREAVPTVAAPSGRMIVVFIQTDFAREKSRMAGQLNFLKPAEELVESFAPEDRIAVFSFDSHLKFRLDFTSDKGHVQDAMRAALRTDIPPPPPIVPNPALASRLDREEMRDAANSETALVLIGNALRHIPGPKTMLLMGWGLGERRDGKVHMRPEWKAARNALDASRTSIFSLDTTVADYHDLEVGLRSAAEQTGGFYAKTHVFPRIAVERIQRTLSGHYEIELRRPAKLEEGTHAVVVRVKRRGAQVLAPQSYTDRR